LKMDRYGNLYFIEIPSCIRKISTAGIITTIAGDTTVGYFGDGGPATNARLNFPADIAVDDKGNVFVSDAGNFVVRKIDTAGIISTFAGDSSWGGGSYWYNGCPARLAGFNSPFGITVDSTGSNLLIVDARGYTSALIFKVAPGSAVLPVLGRYSVCIGSTITMIDSTSRGIWSSSDTSVASINSAGIVTGRARGNTIISYSVADTCGISTVYKFITVSAMPLISRLYSLDSFCPRTIVRILSTDTEGYWYFTSNPHSYFLPVGRKDSFSVIYGSYSMGGIYPLINDTLIHISANVCGSYYSRIIFPALPPIGYLSGPDHVCLGDSIALTDSEGDGLV